MSFSLEQDELSIEFSLTHLKVNFAFVLGETINICRMTNQVHISELEYTIDWKLKDPNGYESTEIKDDARQALELAVTEMKRASEEAGSFRGKL